MIKNFLFLLAFWASFAQCSQKQAKSTEQTFNSGLQIDNGINRGVNYTDPLGMTYSIRYIPITITNDSTISMELQIAFAKEYGYPVSIDTAMFHVIPLPEAWALDGVEITDSLLTELPKYMERPFFSKKLKPGEKWVIAIGTVYPRPAQFSGVLPNTLFTPTGQGVFPDCDWLVQPEQSPNPQVALGLKLTFGKDCRIIPCGQISYPE